LKRRERGANIGRYVGVRPTAMSRDRINVDLLYVPDPAAQVLKCGAMLANIEVAILNLALLSNLFHPIENMTLVEVGTRRLKAWPYGVCDAILASDEDDGTERRFGPIRHEAACRYRGGKGTRELRFANTR
jgi:hypothetical protein